MDKMYSNILQKVSVKTVQQLNASENRVFSLGHADFLELLDHPLRFSLPDNNYLVLI